MTTKRLVCDVCGSDQGVCHFRVQMDTHKRTTKKASADLCDKHGEPFHDLIDKFGAKPGAKSKKRVVTPEYIAQQRRKKK